MTVNLAKLLQRDANNLDIFRVLAACMVIYGHSYALSPDTGHHDFVRRALGFDYAGSLAVKMFFFLSGLVVTNSLLEKRAPVQFAIARFFRIAPALFVTVILSALLLGPLLTVLPARDYFQNAETWHYIFSNVTLRTWYTLPGLFADTPYKATVNGSLWTIPYEVFAYIAVAAIFMLGALRSRLFALLLFLAIAVDPLTGNKLLFTWINNPEAPLLAPCFAFGALIAVYKERINLNICMLLGAWVLFAIFSRSVYSFYFFYMALFGSILYVSGTRFMLRLKPKSDISYGIYLWGFPVQQTLAFQFPEHGIRFHQVAAICVCLVLGFISWHLIEKRAIALGSRSARWVEARLPGTAGCATQPG